MMQLSPLVKRVALAKSLGLVLGLLAPATLTTGSTSDLMLVWGIVLWAVVLGALIGLIGAFDRVPVLDIRLPIAFRGGWVGLWMGVILLLVAHDGLETLWARTGWLPQPGPGVWWLLVEAALAGALIDLAVTAVTGPIHRTKIGRPPLDH